MPTIHANGIQQNYKVAGKGPWLTLIHGSGGNLHTWEFQVPEFSRRYRVLTYDCRGHGETETPDEPPITQETYVEDLRALLDALGIQRTAVLGYSMGAGIARNFAATYPARVWAVVLSNGGRLQPAPDPEREREMAADREQRIAALREKGMVALFDGWLYRVFTPEFVQARPDVVEWHRKVTLRTDPAKYMRTMQGTFSRGASVDLSRVDCPALVIVGEGDEFTNPAQGEELAKALPHGQLCVFPTRHGSAFEKTKDYNRTVLEFLSKAPS